VVEKFGVKPQSIPDWLALVGDSADGYPGIPGWGAKSASAVLSRYGKLESIPKEPGKWKVPSISPGRAVSLTAALIERWEEALLYRQLATVREDVPLEEKLGDLKWKGARKELKELCFKLGEEKLPARISHWSSA
jgi:5'-3' exonuclease